MIFASLHIPIAHFMRQLWYSVFVQKLEILFLTTTCCNANLHICVGHSLTHLLACTVLERLLSN